MATKKTQTYQELREELDRVVLRLQDPDCDVDAAAEMYAQALTLIKQMEAHLEAAENRIVKVKAEFDASATGA